MVKKNKVRCTTLILFLLVKYNHDWCCFSSILWIHIPGESGPNTLLLKSSRVVPHHLLHSPPKGRLNSWIQQRWIQWWSFEEWANHGLLTSPFLKEEFTTTKTQSHIIPFLMIFLSLWICLWRAQTMMLCWSRKDEILYLIARSTVEMNLLQRNPTQ